MPNPFCAGTDCFCTRNTDVLFFYSDFGGLDKALWIEVEGGGVLWRGGIVSGHEEVPRWVHHLP